MCIIDFIRDNSNIIIAFAGLMQAIFAVFLFYNAKQQRDIAKYMALTNKISAHVDMYRNFMDEEMYKKLIDSIMKVSLEGNAMKVLEKKMLGKKLLRQIDKMWRDSEYTEETDNT
ncbi:TPA: hypothetical protein ENS27_04225 [bacterium]|nr:hypothetical protein [bacterium]